MIEPKVFVIECRTHWRKYAVKLEALRTCALLYRAQVCSAQTETANLRQSGVFLVTFLAKQKSEKRKVQFDYPNSKNELNKGDINIIR